jgi:hypothetical protein
MGTADLGKGLVVLGLLLAAIGAVVWLLARGGVPLGHLPGDIRIEREGLTLYVPLTSMILVSIVLTVVWNLVVRCVGR